MDVLLVYVIDDQGEAVPYAEVGLVCPTDARHANADEAGRVRFERRVAETCTVHVFAAGRTITWRVRENGTMTGIMVRTDAGAAGLDPWTGCTTPQQAASSAWVTAAAEAEAWADRAILAAAAMTPEIRAGAAEALAASATKERARAAHWDAVARARERRRPVVGVGQTDAQHEWRTVRDELASPRLDEDERRAADALIRARGEVEAHAARLEDASVLAAETFATELRVIVRRAAAEGAAGPLTDETRAAAQKASERAHLPALADALNANAALSRCKRPTDESNERELRK